MWTLSSLQLHPHVLLAVDEDATLELHVKTVKVPFFPNHDVKSQNLTPHRTQYFKSIEDVAQSLAYQKSFPSPPCSTPKSDAASPVRVAIGNGSRRFNDDPDVVLDSMMSRISSF
jgi:glucosamine-6-phosphate deaminase